MSGAPELLSTKPCNEFVSFNDKIQKIRQALSSSMSVIGSALSLHPLKSDLIGITQFDPINDKTMEEDLQHLKCSCCLVFNVNCMASDLQILKTFSQAMKSADIRPLLKEQSSHLTN